MHIAVAGNIGAGKTTLATRLADHFGWQPLFEEVDQNPYLADFYDDMARWAFPLQINFLTSRFRQVLTIREATRPVVQDRTVYEDAHVFARNLYQSGLLTARDYQNYRQLFDTVLAFVDPPDLLIYLRADLPTLRDRIRQRGRDYEKSLPDAYLRDLNALYEAWIADYPHPLLTLDLGRYDLIERPADFTWLTREIGQRLPG